VDTDRGTVAFHVWDTADQERYRALVPRYSQGAVAISIVFDLTDRESLAAAKDWFTETRDNHNATVIWFLVGNKSDLPIVADVESAREFATTNGLTHIETSAKTGQNVNELFVQVEQFPDGGGELERANNDSEKPLCS
jgi:small GTP-binding protein